MGLVYNHCNVCLQFSKPYNNLFIKAGVPPKRWLTRFLITPEAAVQPGKCLYFTLFLLVSPALSKNVPEAGSIVLSFKFEHNFF